MWHPTRPNSRTHSLKQAVSSFVSENLDQFNTTYDPTYPRSKLGSLAVYVATRGLVKILRFPGTRRGTFFQQHFYFIFGPIGKTVLYQTLKYSRGPVPLDPPLTRPHGYTYSYMRINCKHFLWNHISY